MINLINLGKPYFDLNFTLLMLIEATVCACTKHIIITSIIYFKIIDYSLRKLFFKLDVNCLHKSFQSVSLFPLIQTHR